MNNQIIIWTCVSIILFIIIGKISCDFIPWIKRKILIWKTFKGRKDEKTN